MTDLTVEKIPDICRIVRYEAMAGDPGTTLRRAAEFCGLVAGDIGTPTCGDDSGCAAPYLELMRRP